MEEQEFKLPDLLFILEALSFPNRTNSNNKEYQENKHLQLCEVLVDQGFLKRSTRFNLNGGNILAYDLTNKGLHLYEVMSDAENYEKLRSQYSKGIRPHNINAIYEKNPLAKEIQDLLIDNKDKIISEVQLTDKHNLNIPNPLHDDALIWALNYQKRVPSFRFWLRRRDTNKRLRQGFWFQGTERYASVGLYNLRSNNHSTKAIALVFWPDGDNIGVSFDLIFQGNQPPKQRAFFKEMQELLSTVKDTAEPFKLIANDTRGILTLSYYNSFEVADRFLNQYGRPIENLIKKHGLEGSIISQKDFQRSLDRVNSYRETLIKDPHAFDDIEEEKEEELTEDQKEDEVGVDQILEKEIEKARTTTPNQNVNLQKDTPALEDALGREAFVGVLGNYIRTLWQQYDSSKKEKGKTNDIDAYTLHLDGEWGSGKSSVLRMLKKDLETKQANHKHWVVVEFNAWQNQHIAQPWWIILDTVFKGIQKDVNIFRRFANWIMEYAWRTFTHHKSKWLSFLILISLGLLIIFQGGSFFDFLEPLFGNQVSDEQLNTSKNSLAIITSSISIIASFWLLFKGITNSMLPGNESAASHFKEYVRDPMEKVKSHFKTVVTYTPKNVALFIDDIDRCDPVFVVKMLEGIQTLFRRVNILYVIAGDAAWIRKSFSLHYNDLSSTLDKPGQSLGNFFLEKSLQLSVRMPPITSEIKKAYWNQLLTGNTIDLNDGTQHKEEQSNLSKIESQEERDKYVEQIEDPIRKSIARQESAKMMSTQKVIKEIEHSLLQYHELLEPNPRNMKRLVNNLALEKASFIISGINEKLEEDKIIRWGILKSRYPLIALEILKENNLEKFQETKEYPIISTIIEGIDKADIEKLKM